MIDLSHIAAYTTPALVVVGGGRWIVSGLWHRFEKKLNTTQELFLASDKARSIEATEVKIALTKYQKTLDERLTRVESALDTHGERLAYLEGKDGKPLGTTPRAPEP